MRNQILIMAFFLAWQCANAQQTVFHVDALGERGSYTTIDQAMSQASPGDRILVYPGTYPSFQFDRGVEVVGLGQTPEDVKIESIAYHVSIPAVSYDSLISNVTLESPNPLQTLLLSGNELPPGVLVLDSVNIRGGVFLRGGQQGFYLLAYNCRFEPAAGHGFSGEACYLGGPGNFIELHSSVVRGWNADPSVGAPAGAALRIASGSTIRINGSRIIGGEAKAGGRLYEVAGEAIIGAGLGQVDLQLDGGSVVQGGKGYLAGGDAISLQATIAVADATVKGGRGHPDGLDYSQNQPIAAPLGVSLEATPQRRYGQNQVAVHPDDVIAFSLGTAAKLPVMIVSHNLDLPATNLFLSIETPTIMGVYFSNSVSTSVPAIPGLIKPGFMLYAQGAWWNSVTGKLEVSGTEAIRIDF